MVAYSALIHSKTSFLTMSRGIINKILIRFYTIVQRLRTVTKRNGFEVDKTGLAQIQEGKEDEDGT